MPDQLGPSIGDIARAEFKNQLIPGAGVVPRSIVSYGAFDGVIPVLMHENVSIDKGPLVPVPEAGIRWGRPSAFNFSSALDESGEADNQQPPPAEIRYTRIERKSEIESLPESEYFIEVDTEVHILGTDVDGICENPQGCPVEPGPMIPPREPVDVNYLVGMNNCDLGEEMWNEIVGFTAYADGRVVERFKPRRVKRFLSVRFE